MDLTTPAVKRTAFTYFATFLLVIAGIGSYTALGQLEDPVYTIKQAAVITSYPGASPEEVEQEVTELLELALQQLDQVDYLRSMSRAGYSQIDVYIKPEYRSDAIPQIFDEIRRKVNDATPNLPPGANTPRVNDDVGKVFGLLLAVVGDGFTPRELEDYADDIKRELSLVEGVARVDMAGVQEEVIYVDVNQNQIAELGLSPQTIASTLTSQNLVIDAGSVDLGEERLRFEMTGAFSSPQEIKELTFRPSVIDQLSSDAEIDNDVIFRLSDFATISRGYREPTRLLTRFNGQPAISLAAAPLEGVNVVDVGRRVDKRLEELKQLLPIGIEFHKVAWQSDLVEESVVGFIVSLIQAVLIVLVILWLAMGMANAVIVGTALIMTILGTFVVMAMLGYNLERMSLGALVIALGMMVDNAIVVADGATVRIQKGMDRVKAAIQAANVPSMPLLGATIIAVSFFFPIYASTEDTGEYCASLFLVVAISLLISWIISVTITPLQCVSLIKVDKDNDQDADPYGSRVYQLFKQSLRLCLRYRWITLGGLVAILVASILSFAYVPKLFFPDSSRRQFMIDYWAPEGTRIQTVDQKISALEDLLIENDMVNGVSAFIGAGPPRFYLPVEPERPYPSYAQLIVNVDQLSDIAVLEPKVQAWAREHASDALVRVRRYAVGPGVAFKFEARISGPGNVDPAEIRGVAQEAMDILHATPFAKDIRTDWRQKTKKLVADYDQNKGRWTSLTRSDVGRTLRRSYDGFNTGLYREDDHLIPIVVRATESERKNMGGIETIQASPTLQSKAIPLVQVTNFQLETEDPLIWRRDRRRTITVQAEPDGVTLGELRDIVVPDLEKLELPPGYTMEWGGEYEASRDSQQSLIPGLLPVLILVALILVGLFNSYKTPLIIALVVPFAAIGITSSLLITQAPFGFMAVLGAMSLAGMMIKNAIVLLDQVNIELEEGAKPYDAIMLAALSRLRPVLLAAATTVLGVVPLLTDVFWVSMAVVIMGGLTFGTILTMIVVPVLYAILYQVHEDPTETPSTGEIQGG